MHFPDGIKQKIVIKELQKLGLISCKGGKGSHAVFKNPPKRGIITVPCKCNKGICLSIAKQLKEWGFSEEEINVVFGIK